MGYGFKYDLPRGTCDESLVTAAKSGVARVRKRLSRTGTLVGKPLVLWAIVADRKDGTSYIFASTEPDPSSTHKIEHVDGGDVVMTEIPKA